MSDENPTKHAPAVATPAISPPAPRRPRGAPRTARARATKAVTRRAIGARAASRDGAGLRAAEFMAGGGMGHEALKQVGVEVAWANDICPKKRATYSANFPSTPLDPRSIADIAYHDLPYVNLLHFSIPCQDYSLSGRRAGMEGERGSLTFQVTRLVGEARRAGGPVPVVVVENVEGMLITGRGEGFVRLVVGLHSEGMAVGAVVADAARFVPHKRRRLFLVSWPRERAVPQGLAAVRPNGAWHPTSLRKAVGRLPAEVLRDWHWLTMPEPEGPVPALAEIVEEDRPGMRWSSPRRLEVQAALMRPHDREALEAALARGERVGIMLKKRRRAGPGEPLRPVHQVTFDGLARCLTRGEGYEAQQLIFPDPAAPHGFRTRDLTPRERARLMGLTEDYVLPASVKGALELTGDGLVVDVYRHLAQYVLIPLMRAENGTPPRRGLPRRRRKDGSDAPSAANRPVKRRTVAVDVRLVPAAREMLGRLAQAEGMSLQGFLLACVDRHLATRALPALPRDARARRSKVVYPQPRPRRRDASRDPRRPGGRRGAGARARIADPRSPFRYPGGKAQAAPTILSVLGRAHTLVEPFAGGASVGVRALLTGTAERVVLAERDDGVRAVWEIAAARGREEFEALLRTVEEARPNPNWWEEFLARTHEDHAPHVRAARALLGTRFRWGGLPGGGVRSEAHLGEALRAGTMAARLRAVRAERHRLEVRADAKGVIREFRHDPRAAFFVDPPYSLPGGPAARLYRHHDVDHARLMAALTTVRGRVVATYNDCEEVRLLAAAQGFRVRPLEIIDGHRRRRRELMLIRGGGPDG